MYGHLLIFMNKHSKANWNLCAYKLGVLTFEFHYKMISVSYLLVNLQRGKSLTFSFWAVQICQEMSFKHLSYRSNCKHSGKWLEGEGSRSQNTEYKFPFCASLWYDLCLQLWLVSIIPKTSCFTFLEIKSQVFLGVEEAVTQ